MERTAPKRRAGQSRPRPNLTLLEARIRADLSREDLGRMAGISAKQVRLIETGAARRSRVSTINALARALDRDVLALFPDRRLL